MIPRSQLNRLLASAIFALGAGLSVAQPADKGAAKTPAPAQKAPASTADKAAADARAKVGEVKESAKKGPGGASLQDLVKELKTRRDVMIADHDALAKKLKEATDEEKKAIKEKMEAQMKAFEAQQTALHKQIRDEQRRQRQSSGPKR